MATIDSNLAKQRNKAANRIRLESASKYCPRCGYAKQKIEFGPSKYAKDGLRAICRRCKAAESAKDRLEHPERQRSAVSAWQRRNRDRVNAKGRRWVDRQSPTYAADKARAWRLANPEKAREVKLRQRERIRSSVSGVLNNRIGNALRACLGGNKGWIPTFKLLPYSVDELRIHIERQFILGMDWRKFMAGDIHIDHIRPLASFKFTSIDDGEFRQAWALTNLRPLWALDNLKKSGKRLFLI